MTRPLPWSHSTLVGFDTCPRQYEEIKVLRNFQDQKNTASIWGDEFHTAAENYIRNCVLGKVGACPLGGSHLPANMEPYRDYLNTFVARPGNTLVEQEYALDVGLKPCGFLAPEVWMRGIIDVLTIDGAVAHVDDHKTGKNRKKDMQQLIIFALLTFYHHPEVMACHTTFHWLQLKAKDTETFYRHQTGEMWETLVPKLKDYKRAFDRGLFPPKPSGLCKKHCAVDTCEYFGRGTRG